MFWKKSCLFGCSIQTIVKKEVPEPDMPPSIEDIKQERCDQSPQPVISNNPTDSNSQSSSFQNDSEDGTFHPAQFRPEQTTMQCLPQQKDFQQPLQITDQFQFNNSLNRKCGISGYKGILTNLFSLRTSN